MTNLDQLVEIYRLTKDEEVFEQIYNAVYPIMKGKASQYNVAGNEFEDNISELSNALLRCMDKFDNSKSNFNTYFNMVAKNTMLNLIKSQAIRINPTEDVMDYADSISADGDEMVEVEFMIDLNNCKMSERNKSILNMLIFEGKSQVEIANILNITKGRVTQIIKELQKQVALEFSF